MSNIKFSLTFAEFSNSLNFHTRVYFKFQAHTFWEIISNFIAYL